MPYVHGFLRLGKRNGLSHPDQGLPGMGGHPDQGLPGGGEGPTDPGYGISIDYPDQGLPKPPGVWPPPHISHPIVPAPPGTPPGVIWPPAYPAYPSQGLPGQPGHPSQGLPGMPDQGLPTPPPGTPDQGLPPAPDQGLPPTGGSGGKTFWMLCYCPTLGWNYVTVDPSLKPGMPLPPTATPK